MEPDTKDYDISENAEVVKIDKKMIISVGLKPNVRFLQGGTEASNYNKKEIETVVIVMGGEISYNKEENIVVVGMEKAER